MEEAFDLIAEHGVGESGDLLKQYRLIEAEAITRRRSSLKQITEWLTLEYLPKDAMGHEDDLGRRVLAACNDIAARLGWKHTRHTRVAILAEETDAYWATYPFGYCASKEPYEKICLPNHLLDDKEDFHRAVAHEYAHVISCNVSEAHAPRWLEEAISVLAEGIFDAEIAVLFRQGKIPWLTPADLERVLESRGEDEAELDHVLRAYQQSGWIGRYLCSMGPESKLTEMLEEHTNDQVIRNLFLRLTGQSRTEGAMRKIYGQSVKSIFRNARKFCVG
jgi:hypothetical protein